MVDYTITMFNDPAADVGSIAASIDSTLSQSSTLAAIQDTVVSESSGVVEGTSVTTSGVLAVSGLSVTSGDATEAATYFTAALTEALDSQGVLPDGAVVTVTGVSNGAVQYEITLSADSSTDASSAVSQINSSLSQSFTLTAIKDAAITASSGGSLSFTSLSVDSNTAGSATESSVSKVTSTGQLTTSIDTTGLTASQIEEVANFLEESIASELSSQNVLPAGSYVTVTGINNGIVSYKITLYNDPSDDSSSVVTSIDSALTQASTLSATQTSVQSSSSSGSSSVATALSSMTVSSFTAGDTTGIASNSSLATALSSMTVTGFTAGVTSGVPNNKVSYACLLSKNIQFHQLHLPFCHTKWYPDFVNQANGCINNGYEPSYMKENDSYYLFSSKQDCCEQWFAYDQFCMTSTSTKKKFYPDQATGLCGMKKEKEFESWERDRYDSLEECCSTKFSTYNYENCCNSPGLGGCSTTGTVKFVPDWSTSSCKARSESVLAPWEEIFAEDSATAFCQVNFSYE